MRCEAEILVILKVIRAMRYFCVGRCLTSWPVPGTVVMPMMEVRFMSVRSRQKALVAAGLVHPRPDAVTAELFRGGEPFFFPLDKVQVKYEMLRAVTVDGHSVVASAQAHGYSRGEFYLVQASFAARGMAGLVDERRGRKGPTKLTDEIVKFLREAPAEHSGADLVQQVESRFGVSLHRRTVERARRR
jgi:transposase